jgi:hypothetical protein
MPGPNIEEMKRHLEIFNYECTELRVIFLHSKGHALGGFYTDSKKLINDASQYNGKAMITVGLNPRNPVLLHSSARNRLVSGIAGSNSDVITVNKLLIDIDTVRPNKLVAANDNEIAETKLVAEKLREFLTSRGASLIMGFSGNGFHLIINTVDYPISNFSGKNCFAAILLRFFQRKFGNKFAEIDTGVYDPARLIKLYGTLSIKGGNTTERPFRLAKFETPHFDCSSVDILKVFENEIKEQVEYETQTCKKGNQNNKKQNSERENCLGDIRSLNIVLLFQNNGLYHKPLKDHIHVVTCPWSDHHTTGTNGDTSTIIFEGNGQSWPGFYCKHAHCTDRAIKDILEFFGNDEIDKHCHSNFNNNSKSRSESANKSEWGCLADLPPILPDAPTLNEELIPKPFLAWTVDIAERMQLPLELIVSAVLTVFSSVVGRSCYFCPKQYDDWTIVPQLWGAIVGPPSVLKSPALSEAMRPLRILAAKERGTHKIEIQNFEFNVIPKTRKELKNRGLSDKQIELQIEQGRPKLKRYYTNTATIEKLGELLAENPRGFLIFRDELFGFLKSLENPSRGEDRVFFRGLER